MPEVIGAYEQTRDFAECAKTQQGILSTYRDDFRKYKKRVNHDRVRNVFEKIPLMVGDKTKYVNLDPHDQSRPLAEALDLLEKARVCYRVCHAVCRGVPLRAQSDDRLFKTLFLDVGLMCRSCGLNTVELMQAADINLVNQGAVTEQFIGQHLLYDRPSFMEPELFYWSRQKHNAAAEVDYVIVSGQSVIPVEVKSAKTGRLKSLHVFLREFGLRRAVRFNGDEPSLYRSDTMELLSLPHYLVGQLRRLLGEY